jgi:hypothetical protein
MDFNLFIWITLVYFLEYSIITGFIDRLSQWQKAELNQNFFHKNMFEICSFLYQAGVMLSRGSLELFKFKKTELICLA